MVDLERLVDDPFDLEREALDLGRVDRVRDLAERRQQPAAVDLERVAGARRRIRPNSTLNQKKRDIARMLLVRTRSFSCSSRDRGARRAAAAAQSPKRTSAWAKAGSVCIGTCPPTSWKMSGSGRYSSCAPSRMVIVVGNSRRRRQSKKTYDGT